ncbi:hypothetical protein [Acinetobacter baumannii]|uniref:hypothetical protein n=1 Tax=Acinetobacter baumannii TaxID=470 RepID=UPI0025680F11|nr:hypothetical protein [Acinetobacter baumannii]EKT8141386.1 hypothetical protein [Acinetobacter baumannii]EKU7083927.1 hypothetical protein [Acinetobacter baumannii]EKV1039764.1 hypothetical protein [Acinetobacter baumannii]EKV1043491.1 hypothetical protein [Acinetobacter baumannii]EKV1918609.1 hypothetical protein [Acinetobacter baumannii]
MDNYKIKVNDEAESKEAQELFFQLGYVWADTKCQTPMKFTTSCIYSGFEDGELCRDYYDENPNHQQITLPQLRDLVAQSKLKAQGLISGAEAMIAALDDKEVEYRWVDGSCNWRPFNDEDWSVEDLKSGTYSFRLKPQTIKLDLEIPAPYKAKIGGRDDTSFVLNVGRHQYCYKTEEEYTKARDALEAVFDSAVRGTNS